MRRLVVRGDDKVRVGGPAVVDVVDAGDLRRLVHAQAPRAMQRPEQRKAARGINVVSLWITAAATLSNV